jgi:hypothetical protein
LGDQYERPEMKVDCKDVKWFKFLPIEGRLCNKEAISSFPSCAATALLDLAGGRPARARRCAACLVLPGRSRVLAASAEGSAVCGQDTNPGLSSCESAVARVKCLVRNRYCTSLFDNCSVHYF